MRDRTRVVGIVGSEAAKFTPETETRARALIRLLLSPGDVVCSGHCHLGGVDIFAEEVASALGLEKLIYPPKELNWDHGYRPRNLQIAVASDVVYCITVRDYPPMYKGMRFSSCYHCKVDTHVKSGGCWTVKQALKLGKAGQVMVVE